MKFKKKLKKFFKKLFKKKKKKKCEMLIIGYDALNYNFLKSQEDKKDWGKNE